MNTIKYLKYLKGEIIKPVQRSVIFWNIIAIICLIAICFLGDNGRYVTFIIEILGGVITLLAKGIFDDEGCDNWYWVLLSPILIYMIVVFLLLFVIKDIYISYIIPFNKFLNKKK